MGWFPDDEDEDQKNTMAIKKSLGINAILKVVLQHTERRVEAGLPKGNQAHLPFAASS
jgi:hypothetical protein